MKSEMRNKEKPKYVDMLNITSLISKAHVLNLDFKRNSCC